MTEETRPKEKPIEEQLDAVAAKSIAVIVGVILACLFAFWLYKNNPDLNEYERQKQKGRELHKEMMDKNNR